VSLKAICLWVAPGILCFSLALGGEISQALGNLALLALVALFWWLLALRVFTKSAATERRWGFALSWATAVVVGHLLLGVPRWLRINEDAAVAAVEGWKRSHGTYPESPTDELRAQLGGSDCFYFGAHGASYRLTCSQNMLRRCDYRPTTRNGSCGEP
jgi:hypothetical protein